ncbi:hypothetical protein GCM10008965_04440 [Methylorubrum aminovorans]
MPEIDEAEIDRDLLMVAGSRPAPHHDRGFGPARLHPIHHRAHPRAIHRDGMGTLMLHRKVKFFALQQEGGRRLRWMSAIVLGEPSDDPTRKRAFEERLSEA